MFILDWLYEDVLYFKFVEYNYWLGGFDWIFEGMWLWELYGKVINYINWLYG